MFLNDEEKRMLDGQYGPGCSRAMSLLKRFGEAFDAEKMVKANLVHISTSLPVDLLEEMTEGIERFRTPCSLHAMFNPKDWKEKYGITLIDGYNKSGGIISDDNEIYERLRIFKRLSAIPILTCLPYTVGVIPRPGDTFLATGSSGQVAANSIFGARAGRESASTALAAAVTGVTPYMGLLKKENRYAEILIKIDGLDFNDFSEADYGALGYCIGNIAQTKNVVIDGLPMNLSVEQCKSLTSPLPVSGACTMCHIVGMTPEAPTLEAALGGKKPEEKVEIGKRDLEEARQNSLTNAINRDVDLVVIGCPHCFISELAEIASLLKGKKINQNTRFVLGVSDATNTIAREAGYTRILEDAGMIVTNCCMTGLNPLIYLDDVNTVATNTSRGAHYIQRLTKGKDKTWYGSTKECVQAAVTGKWEI